jgi:hypothetical protein
MRNIIKILGFIFTIALPLRAMESGNNNNTTLKKEEFGANKPTREDIKIKIIGDLKLEDIDDVPEAYAVLLNHAQEQPVYYTDKPEFFQFKKSKEIGARHDDAWIAKYLFLGSKFDLSCAENEYSPGILCC